ncbi:DNA-binding CsgD family transcriptional regulator [Streptomyces sp. SAI-135]|uniref:helix-turn-helix transcriptional regulator n=1 Tax=unclassified Streptomyces TaxID=2593676 RepID=UPI002476C5F0|nr:MULTISPECIES: LuxR C-terminal-related transcriptional regulator [unclassified Streptomyces]MDH6513903.1 DNA-binding CsgD family transcriptional regulator [Streptomyces sp. SAI-090]MDH6622016.1 DNA-binding CsgD family transcriptional regulator [Streptomyces sp. SAI-135]
MDVSSSDALWAGTGLGSLARQALEYLVSHPGADEDAVAAGTGVSATAARTALRSLEAELLAVRIEGQPTRWSAGPPRSSLGALLARKRQELARAELYAEQLDEVYRMAPGRQIASDLFEVVESDEQVGARYAHLLRSSRQEVLHFARPPYVTRRITPTDTSTAAGAMVRPGVRLRSVYDSDGMADDGCLQTALGGAPTEGELRLLPGIPMKLVIFDRVAAIMPLRKDDPAAGSLVVHSSTLLEVLTALFESVWERAVPLSLENSPASHTAKPERQEGALHSRTRDILRLMAAGMKDDAIARALRLSRRTVQTHISDLGRQLGARTRFQIALLAQERGLLGDAEG